MLCARKYPTDTSPHQKNSKSDVKENKNIYTDVGSAHFLYISARLCLVVAFSYKFVASVIYHVGVASAP